MLQQYYNTQYFVTILYIRYGTTTQDKSKYWQEMDLLHDTCLQNVY